MNIKYIWKPKTLFVASAIALGLAATFWAAGYRVNLTPSLPQGIYQVTSGPVAAGELVTFCLESNNPYCDLARERGYLGPGACPSGLRPLLKRLTGLPGDRLEIKTDGLVLNGQPLPGTSRPSSDHQGRELPPSLLKSGLIPQGQALVLSQEHDGSFDSRHFGFVPLKSLKKVRQILTN